MAGGKGEYGGGVCMRRGGMPQRECDDEWTELLCTFIKWLSVWLFCYTCMHAGTMRCQPVCAAENGHLWICYVRMPVSVRVYLFMHCQAHLFCDRVEGRGCFIVKKYGWVLENCTGYGDTLLLPPWNKTIHVRKKRESGWSWKVWYVWSSLPGHSHQIINSNEGQTHHHNTSAPDFRQVQKDFHLILKKNQQDTEISPTVSSLHMSGVWPLESKPCSADIIHCQQWRPAMEEVRSLTAPQPLPKPISLSETQWRPSRTAAVKLMRS